ncbi:hypothetical protein ACP70R_008223 [Stipagrostis hirtigluma subsp. patula]
MGFLLIQKNQGEKEMTRLLFGPKALLQTVMAKARKELGRLPDAHLNRRAITVLAVAPELWLLLSSSSSWAPPPVFSRSNGNGAGNGTVEEMADVGEELMSPENANHGSGRVAPRLSALCNAVTNCSVIYSAPVCARMLQHSNSVNELLLRWKPELRRAIASPAARHSPPRLLSKKPLIAALLPRHGVPPLAPPVALSATRAAVHRRGQLIPRARPRLRVCAPFNSLGRVVFREPHPPPRARRSSAIGRVSREHVAPAPRAPHLRQVCAANTRHRTPSLASSPEARRRFPLPVASPSHRAASSPVCTGAALQSCPSFAMLMTRGPWSHCLALSALMWLVNIVKTAATSTLHRKTGFRV